MKTSLHAPARAGASQKKNPGLLTKLYKRGAGKTPQPAMTMEAPLPGDTATGASIFTAIRNDAQAHPVVVKPSASDRAKYSFLKLPFAFAQCTTEPGQPFEIMLEAFSKLPQYVLVVCCNWSSSAYASMLYETYSSFSNIHMLEPVSSQQEADMLRASSFVYVHGCKDKKDCLQLAKSMLLGLPVIVYYSACNRLLTGNKAFYYSTSSELQEIVFKKSVIDLQLQGMQMKGIADGF